jgi:hypothetical protein
VAFTALILGSVLLAPLMVAMLGMVALIMIVVVAALAILMGIVWAIVGYRRGPDDHLPMRRR